MRILGIMIMALLTAGIAQAATVDLNDGRVVTGDIIKQDDKILQVNVDGVTMTYYADEIKDIDGRPFGGTSASAASAPSGTDASSSVDPDKRKLILQFIDVFGTRQALTNNFEIMIKQIQKIKPDEAQKIRDRVKIDEIIERLVPVYDKIFTSDDLNAFITFYGSAAGQKLTSSMPLLMKESVQESIKYMREKFPEAK